jgi:hypothetical protein
LDIFTPFASTLGNRAYERKRRASASDKEMQEMKKRSTTLGLLLALFVSTAPAAAQTVYNNGAPNGQAGWDIFNDFRAADDFMSAGALAFDQIRFWGLLPTGFSYAPTIFWQILSDAGGGTPGTTAIASGSALAQTTLRTSLAVGFDSWQFDLAVGRQLLGPGVFWLALHDGPIGGITDSTLLWETSAAGAGSQFAVELLPTNEWSGNMGGNLAFSLHDTTVTPEPVTLVLLGSGLLGLAGARMRRRKSNTNAERAAGN